MWSCRESPLGLAWAAVCTGASARYKKTLGLSLEKCLDADAAAAAAALKRNQAEGTIKISLRVSVHLQSYLCYLRRASSWTMPLDNVTAPNMMPLADVCRPARLHQVTVWASRLFSLEAKLEPAGATRERRNKVQIKPRTLCTLCSLHNRKQTFWQVAWTNCRGIFQCR